MEDDDIIKRILAEPFEPVKPCYVYVSNSTQHTADDWETEPLPWVTDAASESS